MKPGLGDRVRIHLSGKCRSVGHEVDRALLGPNCHHGQDGDEGCVKRRRASKRDREILWGLGLGGHIYTVEFTPEPNACGHDRWMGDYSPVELERLS